ncbi:hypothetical protein ES707_08489 [subsurface metagenome]
MKNQYFGDIRDLFKYDLILKIMQQCPSLKQFTFIPMLTANDNRTDGNRRGFDDKRMQGRPGSENAELVKYLHKYHSIAPGDRDFTEIGYFSKRKESKRRFITRLITFWKNALHTENGMNTS